MNRFLLVACTVLYYVSMSGAYYDMWWHVAGRVETFFTPAHLVIYAGIFFVGMAVLLTVIREMLRRETWRPADIPHHRALALTGGGSFLQLLSGVSDGFYHEWIGFDVTIWSPPHLGAIFGGVLIGLGLAMLWWQLFAGWRRIAGTSAALGCVLSLHQFTLAEYNVLHRFDEYPVWFAFFVSLMFGFTMLWARRQLGSGLSVPMMVWLTVTQLFVWAMWSPEPNAQTGIVDVYPFPYLYIGAALLFDGIGAIRDRNGKSGLRWAEQTSWMYFAGLNLWILSSTGRETGADVWIGVFAMSAAGWVLAEGLCRIVSGYGRAPVRRWFGQLVNPLQPAAIAFWFAAGSAVSLAATRLMGTSYAHEDHLGLAAGQSVKYAESLPAWAVGFQFVIMLLLGFILAEGLANWNESKGRETG